MEKYKEVERSIIKTYRKEIWSKFIKAIKDYELIKENDKIMVLYKWGKKIPFTCQVYASEILRHGKIHFDAKYIVMNPGYNEENI